MSVIEIRQRFTNGILFAGEYSLLRDAVTTAVAVGATLSGANLADADLIGADLTGANLADAKLSDANLAGANLSWANLSWANLFKANLAGANLAGANLSWAKLSRANLANSNLAGASLFEADLSGAKWRDGIILTRRPLQIHGLAYPVTILDSHMQIGCELHSLAEWAAFDNERIARMDGRTSRQFWDAYGPALLALAASDGRKVDAVAEVVA